MKTQLSYSPKDSYKWIVTVLSGFFMFLSLYVYRAYHIDQEAALTGHSMFFRAMTHSLIVSSVFYIIEFHVSPHLRIDGKIKPWITAMLAMLIGLNLTFLAFNYFYHWTVFYWDSYFQFYYEYPLILVVPVTLSFLIGRLLSHNRAEPSRLISISSENKKEHFQIKSKNLLFIKSADNYIEIFFRSNQQVNKHLVRRSLKDIEKTYQESDFLLRCHRSYLVNPGNIDQVTKTNSKVELTISGKTIPVSKKYTEHFFGKYPKLFTPHFKISSQTA